jgi:hypothetical protein
MRTQISRGVDTPLISYLPIHAEAERGLFIVEHFTWERRTEQDAGVDLHSNCSILLPATPEHWGAVHAHR